MSAPDSMRFSPTTARTYKDAINALNTLQSNFASIEAIKKLGPNVNKNQLSINEVYEYTRRLGYKPQDFNKLNLIHVTGTKGKGSTCAFTESILSQYKNRTGSPITKIGLFTSPHLKTVRERVRINGAPIDEGKFAKYFFEVWDKLSTTESDPEAFPTLQPCNEVKPMYFKYLTILSFHVFMSEGVDTAIYEVGVGGTYDSTNIIDKPTVTGISSLGIDHTFMLGDTIESIAQNKTGIFKQGCPAIVSQQPDYPQSIAVIKERAKELKVSKLEIIENPDEIIPKGTKLGLAGAFQKSNAALAVKLSSEHLRKLGIEIGDGLPTEFIKGLEDARWDGRCQIISNRDNFENITWYIDGAHTLESVNVSSQWFKETATSSKKSKSTKRVLLFNQQSRENANDLLAKLHSKVVSSDFQFDHVIFTTNVTWSSGKYNSDLVSLNTSKEQVDKLIIQKELAECWNKLDSTTPNVPFSSRKHIFADIETGVNFIKSLNEDPVEVFVCGSLHLVGGFLVVLDGEAD